MLDLEKLLANTDEALAELQSRGMDIPQEAFEMREVMRRCVAAEKLVNARAQSTSLGEVAYVAYCKCSGGKSLVSGADLPQWEALSEQIRHAWVASAQAVFERVLSRLHTDAEHEGVPK
jgi:hypothetical protein